MIRRLFVISDLHLGGVPHGGREEQGAPSGTQICSDYGRLATFIRAVKDLPGIPGGEERELVINGDFADFLLEDDWGRPVAARVWPEDQAQACVKFEKVRERAGEVFAALRELLAAGHRLTMLLGNHDAELSLPEVRGRLEAALETEGKRFRFLYDGEAYRVGRVLIEHGNRYDPWNMIDYSGLRQERSVLSRQLPVDELYRAERYFVPPVGSYLVVQFLNRIKSKYSFVDVLKPENEAVIPLLLAFEPDFRPKLKEVLGGLSLLNEKRKVHFATNTTPPPRYLGLNEPSGWRNDLARTLGAEAGLVGSTADPMPLALGTGSLALPNWMTKSLQAVTNTFETASSFLRLVLADAIDPENAMVQVQRALRALNRSDTSFDTTCEVDPYLAAAQETAREGHFEVLVYGHTHLMKNLILPPEKEGAAASGCRYLNTGTWCNLMRLPSSITSGDPHSPGSGTGPELQRFMEALKSNDYSAYVKPDPAFAEIRVDTGGDKPADARLYRFVPESVDLFANPVGSPNDAASLSSTPL